MGQPTATTHGHIRNDRTRRSAKATVVTVLAVAVSVVVLCGLPLGPVPMPDVMRASAASAAPGVPFACNYTGTDWVSQPTQLMSVNQSGGSTVDDSGYDPAISGDSRYVSFTSYSSQHVNGDTNGDSDIFLRDRIAKTNLLVSRATGTSGALGNDGAVSSAVSADGRHIAFGTDSTNLLGGDTNMAAQFYGGSSSVNVPDSGLLDLLGNFTLEAWVRPESPGSYQMIVSKATGNGSAANNFEFRVNPAGRAEFAQVAGGVWNLVGSSTAITKNHWTHLAVTKSGTTVTHYLSGQPNGSGTISGAVNYVFNPLRIGNRDDLTYGWYGDLDEVAMYKQALTATRIAAHVAAQTNGYAAAVAADNPSSYYRLGETYSQASAADNGSNNLSGTYSGAYQEEAGALTGDNNGVSDIYVRDLSVPAAPKTVRVSVGTAGNQDTSANGASTAAISGDGRFVAFYTDAAIQPEDTNNNYDVYLRDRDTDGNTIFDEAGAGKTSTSRVSVSSSGAQGANASYFEAMSPDARYIVFNAYTGWDPADTNGLMDVYLRDRVAGTTTLMSPGTAGTAANDVSYFPTVSADGSKVAYYSFASNLVTGDANAQGDIFVRDRAAGTTTLESVTSTGVPGANATSFYPTISGNGRYVAWESSATNIVAGDGNANSDVFVRDRATARTTIASISRTNAPGNGGAATFSPGTMSADGRYVAFSSGANNLVGTEDTNTLSDVFIRDQGAYAGHGLALTLGVEPVAQSDEVGLEQFQPYASTDLGTGTAYTHLRSGNLVASFEDTTVPGQGLNTVVRHVYNSKRAAIDTGAGKGWTLAVSDLEGGLEGLAEDVDAAITDFDVSAPISTSTIGEIRDGAFTAIGQLLEFTDGDGTTHRFTRKDGPCGRWISPAGVSLKIREDYSGTSIVPGLPAAYELIRPDGVVYRATLHIDTTAALRVPEWRITSVTDRRGNEITYSYKTFGVILGSTRLTGISHNRTGQVARLDYTADGTLDRIVTLPGHTADDPGTPETTARSWQRQVDYSIDPTTKRLLNVTENNHTTPTGGVAAPRTTSYGYGAAGELTSVADGRNHPTTFSYTAGKVSSITDRRSKTWSYAIGSPDPANGGRTTTTTASPVGAVTTYVIDNRVQQTDATKDPYKRFWGGTIRSITDAGHGAATTPITTNYEWVANRLVTATDGAGAISRYEYNDLGLMTALTRPPPNTVARADADGAVGMVSTAVRSTLTYTFPADFDYTSTCATVTTAGSVSGVGSCSTAAELVRMTASDTPAAQRRITDFQYDSVGNLTAAIQRQVAAPAQSPSAVAGTGDRSTRFSYYTFGGLKTIDGPRLDVADITTWGNVGDGAYGGFDRTGMPLTVTDALAKTKTFAYTPYGLTAKVTDRDARTTTSLFDERDNLVRATDPLGRVDSYVYDANDNKTRENQSGAVDGTRPGRFTTWNYDNNDWLVETATPGSVAGQRTYAATVYDDDGAKRTDVSPRHAGRVYNDLGQLTVTPATAFATAYAYWPNRLLKSVDAPAGTAQRGVVESFYDAAGRVNRRVGAVGNELGERPETATTYAPDGAVATTTETSATGALRTTDVAYNAHGEAVLTDAPQTVATVRARETNEFDSFAQIRKNRRKLDATRWVESVTSYDAAGNQVTTSQATGTGGQLTSKYLFDALGRVTGQTVDPVNPGHKTSFEYAGEGQQLKRTDRINGSPLDNVVDGNIFRTAEHVYNADNTQASMVATDYNAVTGLPVSTLASCNYGPGLAPTSGYDSDGNLLTTRTVSGTTGCTGGTLERRQTFTHDDRGWMATTDQAVRSPETNALVSRGQAATYDADGEKASTTLSGSPDGSFTTTFTNAPSGWTEKITDWRAKDTTTTYLPSGAPSTQTLGSGVATADFRWHADQMPKSLTWRKGASPTTGTVVRSHLNIAYDVGGLRRSEAVSTLQPDGTTTGGGSTFAYDLLDRLTQFKSPFVDPDAGSRLTSDYVLDDGGNITSETARTQAGAQRTKTTSEYPNGRLSKRTVETAGSGGLPATTVEDAFEYSGVGEETKRTSKSLGVVTQKVTATLYDAMGHTKLVDDQTDTALAGGLNEDVAYVYDTADRLISRHEPNLAADATRPKTTLYFYWGSGGALAEEADAVGNSLVRYLADGDGETIAQHGYAIVNGRRQVGNTGTWKWLLPDVNGNVATHLLDNGDVAEQVAYDPYGRPEKGGSSQPEKKAKGSTLGFQGAITDKVTGSVVLGARQYDPTTNRFTTADTFVAGELDLALGTDSLTGNRYLFAAANPVSYYEDGHWPNPFKAIKKLAKKALPLLSFVPVVGTAIDVVSAATGRDWLNGGKKLSGAERAMMLAGAAVGMVPGVGIGAKAAMKVATKAVTKGRSVARVANAVDTVRDGASAVKAARGSSRRVGAELAECNSFVAGTRVLMSDGTTKAIDEIGEGDSVVATDPETGETSAKDVTDVLSHRGDKDLVDLTVNGVRVTATAGHPFWVDGAGWIEAGDLAIGDLVREADGDAEPVTATRPWKTTTIVHNLTVADIHTYHVVAGEPILVHNTKCDLVTQTVKRKSSKTIRKEWEEAVLGRTWPKDGTRNWDVSHKRALADGGTNDLWNIEPMRRADHIRHHQRNGDFARWGRRGAAARRS